jgi:Fe-S cluster assembly iron-binding protein IscA
MPLAFTDRARAALKRLLEETEHEPGQVIRMKSDVHGHYHLVLSARQDDDQAVEYQGEVVMVIKATVGDHLAEHLRGAELDIIETSDGPVLDVPKI